jgi:hypothetical protein
MDGVPALGADGQSPGQTRTNLWDRKVVDVICRRRKRVCTCPDGPLYYVVVRDGARADKIRAGRNRRQAERALRKIAVTVDDGSYQPQLNIAFAAWADHWLGSLERKPSTVRSYGPRWSTRRQYLARSRFGG